MIHVRFNRAPYRKVRTSYRLAIKMATNDETPLATRMKQRRLRKQASSASCVDVVTAELMKCPMPPKSYQQQQQSSSLSSSSSFDNYAERYNLSAKYDSSIVYAIDEILTRGLYSVLARWFCSYVNNINAPGCVVVVGFSADTFPGKTTNHEDDCDGDERKMRDLGGGFTVPYIPLSPNSDYPIFEFKRYTGYPIITILLTMYSSRLSHALSCDGRIDVHSRDSVSRSCKRISESLQHVINNYLNDIYYDNEGRGDRCDAAAARRHDENDSSCDDDGDEEDVVSGCGGGGGGGGGSEEISETASSSSAAFKGGEEQVRMMVDEEEVEYEDDDRYAAAAAAATTVQATTTTIIPGIPLDEMLRRNRRLLLQGRDADRSLANRSRYPDDNGGGRVLVVQEDYDSSPL